ncbi:tetratricopeptide repeat protein [Vibrio hepatarius]|jgi:MSHA biogenesis protein MshN|uniref:MSHA biogenesis protein MshN n=1 Tax=Vibrio hepatarius TaxID=171383 RepID=A0A0M0HVQ3_9VIBR|nr:tetratricopeptide repeat protein [Vibrio hepatarius]KOO06150.1 MSHA biogenesis protein MshN [Vibrio hepatarius]
MSAINQALSDLAKKNGSPLTAIEQAQVMPVKQRAVLPWVVGTLGLSLALGGWAISYQAPVESLEYAPITTRTESNLVENVPSPTAKIATQSESIYRSSVRTEADLQPRSQDSKVQAVQSAPISQPAESSPLIAKVTNTQPQPVGEVVIEHVELTSAELSAKAQVLAKKALDSNDLKGALAHYNEALKYTPQNAKVRKKLSALYYGKGDVRKAVDLLQKGISLENDNISLRLALAKLLIKEKQQAAALSAVAAMLDNASVEYLSLRGGLAQKNSQDAMAMESYQKLVEMEPDSGRWWLGLGIQQERTLEFDNAKASYHKALEGMGLSGQSHQFIIDRLNLIQQLEGSKGES